MWRKSFGAVARWVAATGCLTPTAFAAPLAVEHPVSAQSYQQSLRDNVLPSSFIVRAFSFSLTSVEVNTLFMKKNRGYLTNFIKAAVKAACLAGETGSESACEMVSESLSDSSVSVCTRTEAGKNMAQWLFQVDEDNWFSWEQVLAPSVGYASNPNRQLVLFTNFTSYGVFTSALPAEGLPVIFDLDAKIMTFWVAELFD